MSLHIFKVLHKNDVGHVAKCQDCSNYQLFVGTVIISFNKNQLLEFIYDLERTDLSDPHLWVKINGTKKVLISTTSNATLVVLNVKQLTLLKELLEYTKLLLELKFN